MENKTDKFWQDRTDRMIVGVEWDSRFETREWCNKIPYIPFKQGWLVKVIPPFAGAVVRFIVSTTGKDRVSVYLDCYSQLGSWDIPYWEVYPHGDDVFRCKMEDVDKLVEAIEQSLKEINESINKE